MTPEVYAAVRACLVQFESNVPFLYLDTMGQVTTGIGCDLFTDSDARSLGGQDAVDAWHTVHLLPKGMAASLVRRSMLLPSRVGCARSSVQSAADQLRARTDVAVRRSADVADPWPSGDV